jgi:hypothetical protein
MTTTRNRGPVIALIAADAAILWLARPDVGRLTTDLAHPRRWVAAAGSDHAAAVLAQTGLWLCAVWVAVAVVSVAASRVPGLVGELASVLARHAVPALLRRSIAGAVGASIFLAPLAAGAATPDGGSAPPVSVSASTPAPFDAGSWAWPTSSSTSQHTDGDPVPEPVPWPHGTSSPPPSGEVVVHCGDSLWAIAAHRLGPHADAQQIATVSAQWYQANRHTIGADPSLIRPGQHLHEPTEKGARS